MITLLGERKVSTHAGFFSYDPQSLRLLISTTGNGPALWTLPNGTGSAQMLDSGIFFESLACPWSMVQDPMHIEHQLVGLTGTGPDFTARLARFVPTESRFLPGSLPIGRGVVRDMAFDGHGRLFALLPWVGTVVRVDGLTR